MKFPSLLLFAVVAALLLLAGCSFSSLIGGSDQRAVETLEPQVIELDSAMSNRFSATYANKVGDTTLLVLYNHETGEFRFLDADNKVVKSDPLDVEKLNTKFSPKINYFKNGKTAHMIYRDYRTRAKSTIFVTYDFEQDSILFVDSLYTHFFSHADVLRMKGMVPDSLRSKIQNPNVYYMRPFHVLGNELLFAATHYREDASPDMPILYNLDLSSQQITPLPIYYSDYYVNNEHKFNRGGFPMVHTTDVQNRRVIYGYMHTATFTVYDMETGTHTTYEPNSQVLPDTLLCLDEESCKGKRALKRSGYHQFYYDSTTNRLYRMILKGIDDWTDKDYADYARYHPDIYVQVFTPDFELAGEYKIRNDVGPRSHTFIDNRLIANHRTREAPNAVQLQMYEIP